MGIGSRLRLWRGSGASPISKVRRGAPPDEWLKYVGDRTRNRDTEYSSLQPEIANLRHHIQTALKWTLQQIAEDNRRLESLNAAALQPTPLPKTLETDSDQTYKFVPVRMYFADLDKKLGGTLPQGVHWLDSEYSQ